MATYVSSHPAQLIFSGKSASKTRKCDNVAQPRHMPKGAGARTFAALAFRRRSTASDLIDKVYNGLEGVWGSQMSGQTDLAQLPVIGKQGLQVLITEACQIDTHKW